MDDITSSRAMMTPGITGSATTMITGTLVSIFQFPGVETALAVSFIFGLLIFAEKAVAILYKFIFYIINSLTIFSVAVGLNQAGIAVVQKDNPVVTIERTLPPADDNSSNSASSKSGPFFQNWF